MDAKTEVLINELGGSPEKGKVDFNDEKKVENLKVKYLKESFNTLVPAIEGNGDDMINVNDKIEELMRQLSDFRIKSTAGVEGILPGVYERKDFVKVPG